jgi:peptidoglycan/LPS O-acetylase OafA/YrhL
VGLFFTLSGFLIARSVMMPPVFDPRRYARHRAARILPNYFVCLVVVLCVADARPVLNAPVWDGLGNLFSHLFLVHGWFEPWSGSILVVLWTLSHEWTFYALILAVARPLRSSRWWLVPTAMLACKWLMLAAARMGWITPSSIWGCYTIVSYWDHFAYGILAAGLPLRTAMGEWLKKPAVALALIGLGLALIIGEYAREVRVAAAVEQIGGTSSGQTGALKFTEQFWRTFGKSKSNVLWWPVLLGLGRGLVLMGLCHGPVRFSSWLKWTPLPWMGVVSYSTYLYHILVVFCFERAFKKVPAESLWAVPMVKYALLLGAIYTVSWVIFYHVERPWMKRRGT